MIRAEEALRLPSAQLSEAELRRADAIEQEIESAVTKKMERRGIDLEFDETSSNVIAEVNQRLKRAGYSPNWQALVERHTLNKAINKLIGFKLALSPTDEAYRAADALASSFPQ